MRILVALLLVAAVAAALALLSPHGESRADCGDRGFYWSAGEPMINLRHVFCGELRDGRPKGLHSTKLASTSSLILDIQHRSDEGGGIYTAIVEFTGGRRKLSTFFPDHCGVEQLVRSIQHAGRNPQRHHPRWGNIGLSAPAADLEMFCLDNGGQPFEIRVGALANGRINTAFPN